MCEYIIGAKEKQAAAKQTFVFLAALTSKRSAEQTLERRRRVFARGVIGAKEKQAIGAKEKQAERSRQGGNCRIENTFSGILGSGRKEHKPGFYCIAAGNDNEREGHAGSSQ